jgi:hypothetical protein
MALYAARWYRRQNKPVRPSRTKSQTPTLMLRTPMYVKQVTEYISVPRHTPQQTEKYRLASPGSEALQCDAAPSEE